MDFPDHKHFFQLQNYLWQWPSARAAVMVGAGLSLNSRSSPGVRSRFPTWEQLSRAMFDEIHPEIPSATKEQRTEREKQFNRKSAPRIASEYKAAFGPQQLKSFLHAKIPDTGHQPGDIHKLLLQLPWKDVFTTNYDTLLERAEIPERAYQPVATINDLTTAISPRIVKLHGSFPSHTPFIITEEDYRTYPQRFAPFVNTVRQSLVENAFVLIGFSGDDPNFLEWTGWIRDELEGRHAPIYLVSPLSLSDVDRSLLAQRGVTPIDLSPVFADKNPPGGIHSSALEWFLRSLLAAKPQRPERWPRSKTAAQATLDLDPPTLSSGETEPEQVESLGVSQTLDEETVAKVIKRWRFERVQYPGWLVPTDGIRSLLWHNTTTLITGLFTFAEDWPPRERLLLFREINWRIETAMVPLFSNFVPPLESTLNDMLPIVKGEARVETSIEAIKSLNISDTEIREAWMEIALALLREAREDYNFERWNSLKKKIDQVINNSPQFTDRYYYEQALWMTWNIDRDQARNQLSTWSPTPQSPLAVMWKAGLLAELDELSESRSLLRTALQDIRKSLHNKHGQNIDLLALEGWCTYLLLAVESSMHWKRLFQDNQSVENVRNLPELREEFLERWQELKAWDCDPWTHIEYFDKVLSGEPPVPKKEKQIVYEFDPGHRRVIYSLIGRTDARWLPAFSYVRLFEQVGIPMRLPHVNTTGDSLRNACKWVAPYIDFWNPTLLIRAGRDDELKKPDFMKRTQVAKMEPDLAKKLNELTMEALKSEFSSLSGPIAKQSTQASLLEILIEVLSRLTIILESNDLKEAFSLALELHRQPEIYSHIRLNKSCRPWFKRLFEVADDRQLLTFLPELIRFPLSHGNTDSLNPLLYPWPDPMIDVPLERVSVAKKAHPELLTSIYEAVDWLLVRSIGETGKERDRATKRLIYTFCADLLTKEQEKSFGVFLWEKADAKGLPDLPNYDISINLRLPAPEETDVVSRVKEHLLTVTPRRKFLNGSSPIRVGIDNVLEEQMIFDLALASKPIVQLPNEVEGKIEWSTDEARELWAESLKWWKNAKTALTPPQEVRSPLVGINHYISSRLEGFGCLGMFLARVVLPHMDSASEQDWNQVFAIVSETRERDIYLNTALPYILLHRPNERNKIIQTLLTDLSSDNEKAANASAEAVRHWIHLAAADLVEKPPPAATDELIKRVIFRRPEGIHGCLQQLALLLIEKPDSFSSDQVHLIVSSLTPWRHATCLPLSESRNGDFPEEERPELRVLLGRLASALSVLLKEKLPDQPDPSEISALRELYSSDPLPEVRRSFGDMESLEPNL